MSLDDGPRETMRRDMKYERMGRTLRNQQVQQAIANYLGSPTRDGRILADCRSWLEHEIAEARTNQRRENFKHQLRSLSDFEGTLNVLGLGGVQTQRPGRLYRPMTIEGVTISVQPTVITRQPRPRGVDLAGAVIVDVTKGPSCKTDDAKGRVKNGMIHAAVLLHELVNSTVDPEDARADASQCMILHAHRGDLVAAPQNYRRILRNADAVCRDICRAWPAIVPPDSFDPRAARYRH